MKNSFDPYDFALKFIPRLGNYLTALIMLEVFYYLFLQQKGAYLHFSFYMQHNNIFHGLLILTALLSISALAVFAWMLWGIYEDSLETKLFHISDSDFLKKWIILPFGLTQLRKIAVAYNKHDKTKTYTSMPILIPSLLFFLVVTIVIVFGFRQDNLLQGLLSDDKTRVLWMTQEFLIYIIWSLFFWSLTSCNNKCFQLLNVLDTEWGIPVPTIQHDYSKY